MEERTNYLEENEIDLLALGRALLKRWVLIVLCALIGVGVAFAVHQHLLEKTYSADAKIFISNSDKVITFSDMQLTSELVDDYQQVLMSRSTLKSVIQSQNLSISCGELEKLLTISSNENSHVINITVTCNDKVQAIRIANELMYQGIHNIQKIIPGSEVTIVDTAEADYVMDVTPSLEKYLILGALLGILMAGAYITLLFITDMRIYGEEDLELSTDMPVLSSIPYINDVAMKSYGNMSFIVKESFNTLSSNIALSGYGMKVINITSSEPNEGKSFISLNLAMTLADFGKKVLLIENDLRNPTIIRNFQFDEKNVSGLIDYICEDVELNKIIFNIKDSNMSVIFAGGRPPNPSALLADKRYVELIDKLRSKYDCIIIDTPPIGVVADALFTSKLSDGTIFVCRQGAIDKRKVIKSIKVLESSDCNVIGTVMSCMKMNNTKYGKKYSYYYKTNEKQ